MEPVTTSHSNQRITQANLIQSPLLRLPAELRNNIYSFLFRNIIILLGYRRRTNPMCGALALLETCRQLRIDTHDLFMATAIFDIQRCNLMRFMTTYGPKNISLVKTLVCCGMDTSVVSGAWEDVQEHWDSSTNLLASLERVHVVGYRDIENLARSRLGAVLGRMVGGKELQISTSMK